MSTQEAGPTEAFLAHLGREVRRRRREAGLTMQELADVSGVSRRMLSLIELGGGNPSLVTVGKIAHALGTDFPHLTREAPVGSTEVLPAGEATSVWSSPAGSRAELVVASTLSPPAEVWEWLLVPGDRYTAEPDPPGSEELFVVLEGALTLDVEGRATERLEAGASARLASDRNYAYLNEGADALRFIRIAHVTEESREQEPRT